MLPQSDDTQLMPPPPRPSSSAEQSGKAGEGEDSDGEEGESEEARQRRLETPLAAMLPSKYADIAVTELFPDFRVDKVR